jgi:hypothetical protein
VILPGFTLERREDGPLLQLVRLALIVAAPSRCGGPRGRLARRRRRGPEGLRVAGGAQARNVPPERTCPVTDGSCATPESAHRSRALAKIGGQPGVRRAQRALETVEKVLTGSEQTGP